jgi:hypothetical protein
MKRSTWSKLFLFLVLVLAWVVQGTSTTASEPSPGCKGDTEETCADNGCVAEYGPHFGCRWSYAIEKCGCTLLTD